MKNKITGMAIMGAMFFASSCTKEVINGTGPVVTQERTVSNFTGIDLSLCATVNYTEADSFKVEITAQQNVLNEIITEVNNNRLVIRLPWDTKLVSFEPVIINISAPAVSDFAISGSGKIISSDTLHVSNSDFNISGSGDINIAGIITNDIDTRVSGSGKIVISGGSSATVTTDISGSGNTDLLGVTAGSAKVYTSGSGDTKLNVTNNLDAHISGSGKVYYTGNPAISADISGSGKLIHL